MFKVKKKSTRARYEICPKLTIKGTAMQIEKGLIHDLFCVSKGSWKYHILTICNFALIHPWNLLFS